MDQQKGYGLVLSGGGGKGAFQIGVWKALRELGLDDKISGLSGSSVGAINCALFANGDYEKAEELWLNIRQIDFTYTRAADAIEQKRKNTRVIIEPSRKQQLRETVNSIGTEIWQNLRTTGGLFTNTRIQDLLRENIDFEGPRFRSYDIYTTITRSSAALRDMLLNRPPKEEDIGYTSWCNLDSEQLLTQIIASAAIPVVFPPQETNGVRVLDGGIVDRTPIRPLYQAGYRKFIVVYLYRFGHELLTQDLLREDKAFPDARLIRIIPPADFDDSVRTGILRIDSRLARTRINQGYEAAMRVLDHRDLFT